MQPEVSVLPELEEDWVIWTSMVRADDIAWQVSVAEARPVRRRVRLLDLGPGCGW